MERNIRPVSSADARDVSDHIMRFEVASCGIWYEPMRRCRIMRIYVQGTEDVLSDRVQDGLVHKTP